MRRLAPLLLVGAALLTACSSSPTASPRPSSSAPSSAATATATPGRPTPSATVTTAPPVSPYEQTVLRDGARGLWPLTDVRAGMRYGDTVLDRVQGGAPATDVDGAIDATTGPRLLGQATSAARFTSSGRLVTGLQSGLSSADAFTVELWFRADGCSNSWGRAAGTETADAVGREGVSIFFYPRTGRQPCQLGVEAWHRGTYQIGCPTGMVAPRGRWVHLAATYADGTMTCYLGGRLHERQRKPGATFMQRAPFDIGSAGTGKSGNLSSGSIAQVAVYDTALAPARIAAHAAAQA